MSITATLVLKDNEATIRKCLDSIIDFVDDIVVVIDGSSSDETDVICAQEYDARVYHRDWTGFSDQRNYAIEHAKGDYIFIIDGDEELADAGNLREAIENSPPEVDAFLCSVRSIGLGGQTEMDRQVRCFRNKPEIRYHYPIHNQLRGWTKWVVVTATVNAYYYGSMDERHQRNVGALMPMLAAAEHGSEEYRHCRYFLARSYAMMQEWASVALHAEALWEVARDKVGFSGVCGIWVQATIHNEGTDAAMARADALIAVHPGIADLHWWRAFLSLHCFAQAVAQPGQYGTIPQFSSKYLAGLIEVAPKFGMRFTMEEEK